jgi:hypothetical protein
VKLIFIIIMIAGVSSIRASGQSPNRDSELSINLRVLNEQRSYSIKDSIKLQFEVVNSSSSPIGIFSKLGMGYQGGIILHLLDRSGAEIQPPVMAHDSLNLSEMQDKRNYFSLPPGELLGARQTFILSDLVTKPGHYKLLAEYHSPVDAKYADIPNFWSIDRKSIVSSQIELQVK